MQFLQWALPQLGLRWEGFRRVRSQVCKRIRKRIVELQLASYSEYRDYVEDHSEEWEVLDRLCQVTISRFYRDRGVFEILEKQILLELASRARKQREEALAVLSAGCGSGEEAYTLLLMWDLELRHLFPELMLKVQGVDASPRVIERAGIGCYPASSLRDLPEGWRHRAFLAKDGEFRLQERYRGKVEFLCQDICNGLPDGRYHLIMCRNLAFTYFDLRLQREAVERLWQGLHAGGFLVIGAHENLPPGIGGFTRLPSCPSIWRRLS